MRLPLIAAAIIAAGITGPTAAQDNAGGGEPPAEGAADAAPAAPPPPEPEPPAYNGNASGTVSGVSINVPVVCEGFGEGGPVTVQSDPQGDPGQDADGDGRMVDISATPDGTIAISMLAGNSLFSLNDTSAEVGPNTLSYAITMSFVGGGEDRVEVSVTCD